MPLYHTHPIRYTERFLPLPQASYRESALRMQTSNLQSSFEFAYRLLEDSLPSLCDFELLGASMWKQYRPAVFRYGHALIDEIHRREEIPSHTRDDFLRLKPEEAYTQPCFYHSNRVHLSSQGYLKHMENCRLIEQVVNSVKTRLGYEPSEDYGLVIRQMWDRNWTSPGQATIQRAHALIGLLESQYPDLVVSDYHDYQLRCAFSFAIRSEAWQSHLLQQASRASQNYMRDRSNALRSFASQYSLQSTFRDAAQRVREWTDTQQTGRLREEVVEPNSQVITHLNGSVTVVTGEGIRRLYGVAPPPELRGFWPDNMDGDLVDRLDPTVELDRTLDRAYCYDASSLVWSLKPQVYEMTRYSEDRVRRVNAQNLRNEQRILRDFATQTLGEFYARETDSSTNQSDEGSDAGTQPDLNRAQIPSYDWDGTPRESAF